MWAEDRSRLAACWPIGGAGEGRATFWDVRERSRGLAGILESKGVGAGDRVAIVAPLGIDFAIALVSVLRVGAVAMPIDTGGKAAISSATLRKAKPVAIVATATCARRLGKPAARARVVCGGAVPGWTDASTACIAPLANRALHPSGADAVEIGAVRHSSRWIFAQRWVSEYWLDLRRTDLHGAIASTTDPLGIATAIFAPWINGTAVAWRDTAARGSVADWLDRYPISTLAAPRAAFEAPPRGRGELRHCVALGPVAVTKAHAWHDATGLPIHTGFGLAECPVIAAHLRGLPVRAGSIGRPFPGHDVVVAGDELREAAPGEEGELAIRGRPPTLAVGSSKGKELHPLGIRGRRDEQGYLWLAGTLA